MGQAQPPSDSMSADAQRLAAVNEGDAKLPNKGQRDPATQSATDRVENLQHAAENVRSRHPYFDFSPCFKLYDVY